MTDEEYFRKNYPDSCYGDKPLSPHWDFFQDGVEFGERQSEKKIADLEKENAQLKDYRLTTLAKQQTKMSKYALNLEHKLGWYDTQLTKTKEIIKDYMIVVTSDHTTVCSVPEENRCINVLKLNEQAEQFLNSEVEK